MNREELIDVNKRIKSYKKGAMLLMFLAFLLGVLITAAYYEFYNSRQPIPQIVTQTNEVIGLYTSDKFDFPGQWIHVKIEGLTYSTCVSTAQHECGHAYFAQLCETHDETCKQIENYLANQNGN